MKRIISLTLSVLMLFILLLSITSCELSMEAMTGYTRLRDHVIGKADAYCIATASPGGGIL